MIQRLLRLSVLHPIVGIGLAAVIVIAGGWAIVRLPIDAVPDVTNVQVQILTTAPALSPLDAERQITFPIEVAMSGLPNVEEIRSLSKAGLSAVTVVFADSVDIYFARQLVFERLQQARTQIPDSIGDPEMGPISTGLGEIYQYELRSKPGARIDAMTLRTVQDWSVRRQLLTVPGITEVNSFGGMEKQYQVRVDPARLQSYGLSLRDVVEATVLNNENAGGAYIEHGSEQYLLRGIGLVRSIADLQQIVIRTGPGGVPIYLRNVADVVVAPALRPGAVTADGEGEIVAGIAMMLKGENSRTVVERVKARIDVIRKTLPSGIDIVPFYDRTELVARTIHTVQKNLVEGALLVILVLVVLLGNWRAALLVASIIPLSMLFAAFCMNVFGVSGNLMSLGALDFGLIVDGAVVMAENAVRRVTSRRESEALQQSVLSACAEVGRPVVFAVGIIMIVYLPILTLTGIEGKMFKPMALTVIFALAGSLLLSLTYIPAAVPFVLRHAHGEKESILIERLKRPYLQALDATMRHRRAAVVVASLLVGASAIALPFLGSEFIPRLEEGSFAIEARLLPSVSLRQAVQTYSEAERVLRRFPEVVRVVSKIGSAEVATDPVGVNAADIFVELQSPSQWKSARTREELAQKMAEALDRSVPGATFSFSQPIEMRMAELIAGVRSDIAVKVFGDDLTVLRKVADKIADVLRATPGAEDVRAEQTSGLPQLQITPIRSEVARYGLNVHDVTTVVESLVAGIEAGEVFEGEQRVPLVVRFAETASSDIDAVRRLTLVTPSGARVRLGDIADVRLREGPAQISRDDTRRRIAVELNVRGTDIGTFVQTAQDRIDRSVDLPSGYYITWGGQFENLQRARARLLIVVPLALALIFVMLFATFHSARQATLIYTGIPFAVVGGVFALALRGMPFSISAGVGFIALFGVAVLNGVVMVSAINRLREEGRTIRDAVLYGAETRLRPVLMTALVASLGFVPMALAASAGSEVQRPLATVVIGGLFTSTLLTLLLLPTLYAWLERDEPFREPVDTNAFQADTTPRETSSGV